MCAGGQVYYPPPVLEHGKLMQVQMANEKLDHDSNLSGELTNYHTNKFKIRWPRVFDNKESGIQIKPLTTRVALGDKTNVFHKTNNLTSSAHKQAKQYMCERGAGHVGTTTLPTRGGESFYLNLKFSAAFMAAQFCLAELCHTKRIRRGSEQQVRKKYCPPQKLFSEADFNLLQYEQIQEKVPPDIP